MEKIRKKYNNNINSIYRSHQEDLFLNQQSEELYFDQTQNKYVIKRKPPQQIQQQKEYQEYTNQQQRQQNISQEEEYQEEEEFKRNEFELNDSTIQTFENNQFGQLQNIDQQNNNDQSIEDINLNNDIIEPQIMSYNLHEINEMEDLEIEIQCLDNKNEIENFIKRENIEQIDDYDLINNNLPEKDYKQLYNQLVKKSCLITQLLKNKKQDFEKLKQKNNSQQEKIMKLHKKNNQQENQKDDLQEKIQKQKQDIQLLQKQSMEILQNMQYQANQCMNCKDIKNNQKQDNLLMNLVFAEDTKDLNGYKLQEIDEISKSMQKSLQIISDFKTQKLKEREENGQGTLCVICQVDIADILIRPCNHLCLCDNCSQQVNECPLDRRYIGERTKIFLGQV